MTLIKSISGIRGTIGGKVGQGLSPVERFVYSCIWHLDTKTLSKTVLTVVLGRDAKFQVI